MKITISFQDNIICISGECRYISGVSNTFPTLRSLSFDTKRLIGEVHGMNGDTVNIVDISEYKTIIDEFNNWKIG